MRIPGTAGSRIRKWLNPTYLVSAAAALLIGLTLMSLDPDTAQATRHSVLAIPDQASGSPEARAASSSTGTFDAPRTSKLSHQPSEG